MSQDNGDQEICAAVLDDSGHYKYFRLSDGASLSSLNGHVVCLATVELLHKYGQALASYGTKYVAVQLSPEEARQW